MTLLIWGTITSINAKFLVYKPIHVLHVMHETLYRDNPKVLQFLSRLIPFMLPLINYL